MDAPESEFKRRRRQLDLLEVARERGTYWDTVLIRLGFLGPLQQRASIVSLLEQNEFKHVDELFDCVPICEWAGADVLSPNIIDFVSNVLIPSAQVAPKARCGSSACVRGACYVVFL